MVDLSLILFDDIYEELKKRYDAFIFSTMKNINDNTEDIQLRYWGGKAVAIGLAEWTKHTVMGEMDIEAEKENNGV